MSRKRSFLALFVKIPITYPKTPKMSAKTPSQLFIPKTLTLRRFWDIYNIFSELVREWEGGRLHRNNQLKVQQSHSEYKTG